MLLWFVNAFQSLNVSQACLNAPESLLDVSKGRGFHIFLQRCPDGCWGCWKIHWRDTKRWFYTLQCTETPQEPEGETNCAECLWRPSEGLKVFKRYQTRSKGHRPFQMLQMAPNRFWGVRKNLAKSDRMPKGPNGRGRVQIQNVNASHVLGRL